ncbi:MAG TPA: MlaD family protein [Solirubrobacteraceae bacterium]|jgi:ABC-type transporter Mla subunit MlaD|nr:MlaD family protein [Solirubrobacteraceae bacterium]
MRRILATAAVLLAAGAFVVLTLGSSSPSAAGTYKIELDNAFGLVNGADFKVAGVIAGSIQSIDLDKKTLHAVVTVQSTAKGFGQFHSDAFCQSRPQSLIGEYFLDCEPGRYGKVLPPGSTIPVTHTQSTIPADLVQNIMRLPYRERFSLIINELGAAVASRSEDLQSALRRADPALAETDNLLALLANDAHTIRDLNANADSVITALAKNNKQVQRFIVEANNASTDSATQASSIQATWQKLPAFLQQLRPAMAKLGAAADAQDPVFTNLNAASSNLRRFFADLVPFSHESVPSLQSLGQASVTGKPAVQAATPTVAHLNQFAKPSPELAQNLAIVLQALDTRTRTASAGGPVEPDPRSPGGKGYTGLEGLIEYVFNQENAIDYFGPYGHLLGVDLLANTACSPYATPQTIANNLDSYQKGQSTTNPRSCYAFLGPQQPGVTVPDPTWNAKDATPANPSACVPDPGGAPVAPGYGVTYTGAKTNACKLPAQSSPGAAADKSNKKSSSTAANGAATTGSPAGQGSSGTPLNLSQTIGQIVSQLAGGPTAAAPAVGSTTSTTSSGGGSGQAQQLLNYLLSP